MGTNIWIVAVNFGEQHCHPGSCWKAVLGVSALHFLSDGDHRFWHQHFSGVSLIWVQIYSSLDEPPWQEVGTKWSLRSIPPNSFYNFMMADKFIVKLAQNNRHSLEFFDVQFQTDNPGKKMTFYPHVCSKHIQEGLVFLILARSKRAADAGCVLW